MGVRVRFHGLAHRGYYHQVTFYQANWQKTQNGNETPGTLSAYSNAILFGGYYRDGETGLYNVRNRYYHVQLGWLTRDPLGYAGGVNPYGISGDTIPSFH